MKVTKKTPGAWRGRTWFFLKGAGESAGPVVKKRYSTKSIPRDATEVDKIIRKSGAEPESRGILTAGLSIHGIERVRFGNAQRECPDLRAVYLGKVVESKGDAEVRKAMLELRRRDRGVWTTKCGVSQPLAG